jgi:hypothetical protein
VIGIAARVPPSIRGRSGMTGIPGTDSSRRGDPGAGPPIDTPGPEMEILARVLDHLQQHLDSITGGMLVRVADEIPAYRPLLERDTSDKLWSSMNMVVALFLQVARERRRVTRGEITALIHPSAGVGEDGVLAKEVLEAIRVAARVGWEGAVESARSEWPAEEVLTAMATLGSDLMTFIDDIGATIMVAQARTSERALPEVERRQRAFFQDLLAGTIDSVEEARSLGAAFGYDPETGARLVVAGCGRGARRPNCRRAPQQAVAAVGAGWIIEVDAVRPAHMVLISPESSWAKAARTTGTRFRAVGTVGVYSNGAGWDERAASYRRLCGLLPTAVGALPAGGLVDASELGIYAVLASSAPDKRRRFVDDTQGAILSLPEAQSTAFLDSLSALHENGGSVADAARALSVHPKTIQYRAARIGQLTGLDLHRPASRLRLDVALTDAATGAGLGHEG